MTTLPGVTIDLITDGADLRGVEPEAIRSKVVAAVRSVMFSAHRAGVPYDTVHTLLTDIKGRRLAEQLATGRGGRTIPIGQRARLLRHQWQEVGRVVAATPSIDREAIQAHLALVRDEVDGAADMSERERLIMLAVLDLAERFGTTRVAASTYAVAERTGLPQQTVSRILRKLAGAEHWLSLAKRGDARVGKANLYRVGPGLAARSHMGASPPMTHDPPMTHPPMTHPPEEVGGVPKMTLTVEMTEAEQREVLALLNRLRTAPDVRPGLPRLDRIDNVRALERPPAGA